MFIDCSLLFQLTIILKTSMSYKVLAGHTWVKHHQGHHHLLIDPHFTHNGPEAERAQLSAQSPSTGEINKEI